MMTQNQCETNRWRGALILLALVCAQGDLRASPQGQATPELQAGHQSVSARDQNSPREFPAIASREQWQTRAKAIREQILVSCGLWPMPEKTRLQARVFDKVERDGYSIEKVYFETYPGFYLAGNLYRPLGRGPGPFPAILNPHGHSRQGRLTDSTNSTPARCISFARQGMIAFSYDMVGYNDTRFADAPAHKTPWEVHRYSMTNRSEQLWSISLMGLQTWNSIRALDFLESLPGVDRKRLACTGESGGGTQTFILGAIDDRLAAQAPVVMVSHTMQGGCLCENAPGLRIEHSNMEFAAAAAPRSQLLVAATGDWTKDTLTIEGPSIEKVYQLFNSADKFRYVRFDFGHNYNQTSREAVYDWFGKWLREPPDSSPYREAPCQKEPDALLRVFPENRLPANALTQPQFIESLKGLHRAQWQGLVPRDKAGLARFKNLMLPAWRHTLQVDWPCASAQIEAAGSGVLGESSAVSLKIQRPGQEAPIWATYRAPSGILTNRASTLVVLCVAEGGAVASRIVSSLLGRGIAVLSVERFSTGDAPDLFANFFTTYNRTRLQERVRDLLDVCAAAQSADARKPLASRVVLWGAGRAGLWALLAAPAADAVIADCDNVDLADEQTLLSTDLFCPGLLAVGGFESAAMLAAPHPLLLHHTGAKFSTAAIRSAYQAAAAERALRIESGPLSDEELVQWLLLSQTQIRSGSSLPYPSTTP